MNPLFRPKTIKTILASAPLVIQGAGKLIQLIREKDAHKAEPEQTAQVISQDGGAPVTLDSLNAEIRQLSERLQANSEADVEQIRLIEELARQNEALAETVTRNYSRLTVLGILCGLALVLALLAVLLAVS